MSYDSWKLATPPEYEGDLSDEEPCPVCGEKVGVGFGPCSDACAEALGCVAPECPKPAQWFDEAACEWVCGGHTQ